MIPLPKIIADIYQKYSGEKPFSVVQLPATASDRLYFRITSHTKHTVIATHSSNLRENNSFINLARHFASHKLNVPQILHVEPDFSTYIQEDLGDMSLFSLLQEQPGNNITEPIKSHYTKALKQLIRFQIDASKNLDFSQCYPVETFDKQSMMWDLNYFKYYFLKPSTIQFEEDLLEKDFHTITDSLQKDDLQYFMFRDFQSRNIMISGNEPWLIDFQGGRKGPVLYDLASCILDAKANLPQSFRNELTEIYYDLLPSQIRPDRDYFHQKLAACKLIRLLQALGAYGYRGMIQKKELFLQSIPYAAANLKQLLSENLPVVLPHLTNILQDITDKYSIQPENKKSEKLTVRIYSFSYKKGIPEDSSTNGGGFVFDCRSLPNPGRIAAMQTKTGFDKEVKQLLESDDAVGKFLASATELVSSAINNYLDRKFSDLMVSFGCTGGQHRSVFCANALAAHLQNKYPGNLIIIDQIHRELLK
jgi:aminoglycoside/choline kinase family phosphotransferase